MIHESSYIDKSAKIGENTRIWHFCHVSKGVIIGNNCILGQNVYIGENVVIGDNCKIQNNVSVYTGVTLEKNVFVGPSVVFTNVYNPRAEIDKKAEIRSTVVMNGATIGANATIICGITIGVYSFIGAGSLVNKNILGYCLAVGNPAKVIGSVNKEGIRI